MSTYFYCLKVKDKNSILFHIERAYAYYISFFFFYYFLPTLNNITFFYEEKK